MRFIKELEKTLLTEGYGLTKFSIYARSIYLSFRKQDTYSDKEIKINRLIDIKTEEEKEDLREKTELEVYNALVIEFKRFLIKKAVEDEFSEQKYQLMKEQDEQNELIDKAIESKLKVEMNSGIRNLNRNEKGEIIMRKQIAPTTEE